MIELRNLHFGYDEDHAVLEGVDLTIGEGELVLVAGRTGSGKSTLLGTFNGLVPSFTGGTLSGDIVLDGTSIIDLPPRERAEVIGYVGQDPLAGFVTDTVEEELAYGMEQLGLDGPTMRRRVEETLDLLGIADLRRHDLRTLSGGQQQRVAVGSVLTMHPRILVLDEPTSALDPTAAEDVLATITRLVHDLGISVVIAEHRLERVVPFADRMVLVTGDGGLVDGPPAEVLRTSPVAPPIVELGRLLDWEPLPLTVRDARRLVAGRGRGAGGARPSGPAPDSPGRPTTPSARSSLQGGQSHPRPPRRPGSGPAGRTPPAMAAPGLVASGVEVRYGATVAVAGVDLDLAAGSVTALMGRNGSGKSSLLWALQGSGTRSRGRVLVDGDETRTASAAQRRGMVALVPQTAADLLYLESVAEECAAADEQAGVVAGSARKLLDELAPGIPDEQHPRDLSEGQRLALVLAVVLASSPPVLLLDEPTRGLDYAAKAALARTLRSLAGSGRAVLVSTHDVEFVAEVADDVVVLADGEVVSSGPTAEVVAQTPAFAPQVHKVLGGDWLTVAQVAEAASG